MIFDATLFAYKSILPANFVPIRQINEGYFCTAGVPDAARLRTYMQGRELLFLDVESDLMFNPEKFTEVQYIADRVGPAQYGFFGVPTPPWGFDQYGIAWKAWIMQFADVLKNTDAFFPGAYLTTTDIKRYLTMIDAMVGICREIDPKKPVYPFLWWNYADWVAIPEAGKYMGSDNWNQMIKHTLRVADGAVIWGGYQQRWDNTADWWRILANYL